MGFGQRRQCRSRGRDVKKGLPERRDEGPETKSSRRPFTDHKSAQCLASKHYLWPTYPAVCEEPLYFPQLCVFRLQHWSSNVRICVKLMDTSTSVTLSIWSSLTVPQRFCLNEDFHSVLLHYRSSVSAWKSLYIHLGDSDFWRSHMRIQKNEMTDMWRASLIHWCLRNESDDESCWIFCGGVVWDVRNEFNRNADRFRKKHTSFHTLHWV